MSVLSPKEKLQQQISYAEETLADLKSKLANPTYLQHASVMWEIVTALEPYEALTVTYSSWISIYVQQKITPDLYDEIWQTIESILTTNNYAFHCTSHTSTYFKHPQTGLEIDIDFQSSVCTEVPTGKLIPEKVKDCSYIVT